MLTRLRRFYRAVIDMNQTLRRIENPERLATLHRQLSELDARLKRLDALSELPNLSGRIYDISMSLERLERLAQTGKSPVDMFLYSKAVVGDSALFHPSYDPWRATRILKMLEIYGNDYFKGRRILECGSGHSDIGAFFAELGAEVVCLEGRAKNVAVAKLRHRDVPRLSILHADLEEDFSHLGRFDLIINFGLLYHLKKIDEHLRCCFAMSDDVLVETVVCDSTDPYRIEFVAEQAQVTEESLHGLGCRPSPFYVERIAQEAGFVPQRIFTGDLNVQDQFVYDWQHKDDGNLGDWRLRRFWRMQRSAAD